MKTLSSLHCFIFTAGLLLLPGINSHISAQDDPFKKDKAPSSQAEQPLAADTFQEIADRAKPGILGVAVYDFRSGSMQGVNLSRPFPMQSVFKIFLSTAVLSQVDAGQLSLDKSETLAPQDLRDGQGSIDRSGGGTFTTRDLLRAALIESDNTAGDALLQLAGGPDKVTAWLRGKGIDGVRMDRNLREMGRDEVGVPPDLSPGRNDSALESAVSMAARQAAFKRALSDPRDTATPAGAIHFLVALKKGDLLSGKSTDLLLGWLREVKTGQGRLRAGLSSQTTLAHKTGTGPTFEGVTLATNDIGIATLPDGRTLAIVAFLAGSPASDGARNNLLATCARVATQSN